MHRNPLRRNLFRPVATLPSRRARRRSWGWVVAVLLVIAALVAVAILGTLLLTRDSTPKVSQEDMVRTTIQNFDAADPEGRPGHAAQHHLRHHPRQLRQLRRAGVDGHPCPGRRGQAVSGRRQHRSGGRQRRPRRGQRHHVHGLCAADPFDAQLRPAVPRRAVEDLPGAPVRAAATSRSRWRSVPGCTGCRSPSRNWPGSVDDVGTLLRDGDAGRRRPAPPDPACTPRANGRHGAVGAAVGTGRRGDRERPQAVANVQQAIRIPRFTGQTLAGFAFDFLGDLQPVAGLTPSAYWIAGSAGAVTRRWPALCRSLHASTTRSDMPASAFFR